MSGPIDRRRLVWAAITLLLSAAGGYGAYLAGLPAAFLCGGAVVVSIASVAGLPTTTLDPVRDCAFIIIGMSMGAAVAPDSLSLLPQWPFSIAGLFLALAIIIPGTAIALNLLFGLDRITAFLSSCPGHLSLIIGVSEAGRGNTRQIAVIQSIRVLLLTIAVPLATKLFTGQGATPTLEPAPDMPLLTLILLAAACAATGFAFKRLGVPAGFVLGSMIAATITKLTGLFTGSVPLPLVIFSFIFMGALIGSRFAGATRAELRASVMGGLVVTAVAIGVVALIALGVSRFVDMPYFQIWIALSPGGLETMGALGVSFGYDTAFIAAHHALRLLVLGFLIPLVSMALMQGMARPPGTGQN
jgi:membrane AbrB-like protein